MPIETKVKLGGIWRFITQPEVEFGGLSRQITTIEVKSGGVWRTVFSAGTIPACTDMLIIHTDTASNVVNAGIHFNYDDGSRDARDIHKRHRDVFTVMGDDDSSPPDNHDGEWTADTIIASEWEVACVSISLGAWTFEGAALGVYVSMDTLGDTSTFGWRVRRGAGKGGTPGTTSCRARFRLREKANTGNFTEWQVECKAIQT